MYTDLLAFVIATPLLLGIWYGILGGLLFMLYPGQAGRPRGIDVIEILVNLQAPLGA